MITSFAKAIKKPSRSLAFLLALAPLAALLWCGYEIVEVSRIGDALQTLTAPRGGLSLQLAPTAAGAAAIRDEWSRLNLTSTFADSLRQDFYLILAYVAFLALATLWAGWVSRLSARAFAVLFGLILAAGVCDLGENWLLGVTINAEAQSPVHAIASRLIGIDYLRESDFVHAVTLARLAAMSKFSFLLLAATGLAASLGGAVRLFGDFTSDSNQEMTGDSFETLIALETKGLFANSPQRTMDVPGYGRNIPADEEFVKFRSADVIGLALSGGGIRSATFNLGLLQGLQRIGLLRLFDYVATVSGGGYVGSFWSEWLARRKERGDRAEDELFPTSTDAGIHTNSRTDTNQERHLREFSSFLAPRIGFFEVEMWTAVVALLGGLVPALVIGLSVIGAGILCWLALTFALASSSPWAPASVIALVTAIVFLAFELMWQQFRTESAGTAGDPPPEERRAVTRGRWHYALFAALTVGLVLLFQRRLPDLYEMRFEEGAWPIYSQFVQGGWYAAPDASGIVRWWTVTGIKPEHPWIGPEQPWLFSPRLFDFALVWLITGVLLLLLRVGFAVKQQRPETRAAFDRVVMRVLGLVVFWTTVATVWHVAINVSGIIGAATGAVATGGAFAALRNWIGTSLRRPTEASLTDRLKPYLPQVLAYLTIGLSAVAVGGLLIKLNGDDWFMWWISAVLINAFLVLAFFIKPEEFGLHAFYRDRICRAYAGACNLIDQQTAIDNRGTDPRSGDDRNLSGLVDRPLHLVCCAANDLSGDQVETLNRGARSAVLSKHGFALGRHFHAWTTRSDLKLGSAITASAAAFNSNMGQISVRVGPAVSFLMTMLNLRLGLWLRHPAAPAVEARRWPGLLLYREMFAFTSSSGRFVKKPAQDPRLPPSYEPGVYLRDVHLSDGAHFENLALYELVRRHCRYVLVSDCGADPTVAFDDLGNALRRIREDFGVDIDLDVSSLRPGANGCSAQHVAVGTIHYSQTDRGILLYVKPSMTGDEPTDVQQYMTRNKAFPHETTGDQFYDEAQWESYRRLGLHAADCMFDFVKREDSNKRNADWVFAEASHRWGPTPEGLKQSVVEMTQRFGALEAELHERAASGIVKEIFPELAHLPPDMKAAYDAAPPTEGPAQRTDAPSGESSSLSDVTFLMRVIQLMEDAWLTCQLDQWWTHPLNLGWINLFARWATSPLFRFWWPLLSPMFSPGFRRFIDERFPVRARIVNGHAVPLPPEGTISLLTQPATGLAVSWWAERSAQRLNRNRSFFQNVIELPHPRDQKTTVPLQVGLIGVTGHGTTVGWTSEDFFVPPSLWGAGLGWYFLKNILRVLSRNAEWCYVIVKMPPDGSRHQVALDDRHGFLEQYRKIGFREQHGKTSETVALDQALCDELGYEPQKGDTLLSLDLKQWRQRQEKPAGDDAQTERR